MKDYYECELLFGGKQKYEKKDKATGKKLGIYSYMYCFLEVNQDKNFVNSKTYFSDESFDCSKLQLLKACKVLLDISPMSDFKKFVGVLPL